jgi:hypothetical protein
MYAYVDTTRAGGGRVQGVGWVLDPIHGRQIIFRGGGGGGLKFVDHIFNGQFFFKTKTFLNFFSKKLYK